MDSHRFSDKSTGLSPAQLALLQRRLKGRAAGTVAASIIPRRAERASAPLSFIQQESLRMMETHDVPPGYLGTALHYSGVLDLAALQESVAEVSRRHESLRTGFVARDGVTVQVVDDAAIARVPVIDLSERPPEQRNGQAQQLAAYELARAFDPAQSPLWRVKVFRLGPEEYVLTFTLHHLVADFISLGLLIQELGALYDAFSHGRPSPLPELRIQYGDWAAWQREQVAGGGLEAQLAYWRKRLHGCPPVLELPFTRPRPASQTFHGALRLRFLPLALSDALRELSRQQKVSLYSTLLAAFSLLLRHYTRREDIVLGRGVTGRTLLETEKMIGCFINLVVLRIDLSGDPEFPDLLRRIQAMADGAYANQDVPFAKLVAELRPDADPRRPPLAQLIFNLYTAPASPPEMEKASFNIFDLGEHAPHNDVALFQDMILGMQDSGNRIIAELKYNRALFEVTAMECLLDHYQTFLETIVGAPEQPVRELLRQAGIACAQTRS